MGNLLTPRDLDEDKHPASKAFDSATHALTDQFEETLSSTFRTLDNIQRGMVSLMFSFLGAGSTPRREGERELRRESSDPRVVTEINWRSEPAARTPLTSDDLRTGTY